MSPLLSAGDHSRSVSSLLDLIGDELRVYGKFRELDVPDITAFLKEHKNETVVFERMNHERAVYLQCEGVSVKRINIRRGRNISVKAERHLYTE